MKVEFGPGSVPRDGYYHVDVTPGAHVEWVGDAMDWLALQDDDSVAEVYVSHLIEHLPEQEAPEFLRECSRVLISGGRLELHTVDMEKASIQLLSTKGTSSAALRTIYGLEEPPSQHHRWGYTEFSLVQALLDAGFACARRLAPGDAPWCPHDRHWANLPMEAHTP